jgi:archaemetzincin
MSLKGFILLLSVFLNTEGFAKERNPAMGIGLVAVGRVEPKVIEVLKNDLSNAFGMEVMVVKGMPEAEYAFNRTRNQYLSTAVIHRLMEQKEYTAYEKVLGIVDHDLYVPELNFVFGEASQKAAIISITRLRQEFYHQPEDPNLFHRRILTEAVHELGHTYGLGHCKDPQCVMFFSNSLMDTDRKGPDFCPLCKNVLFKKK